MFGASSELVRSWFEAEIWPIIQLASSELLVQWPGPGNFDSTPTGGITS